MKELEKIDNIALKEKILELNEEQLKKVSRLAKDYFILEFLDLKKLEKDNFLINGIDNSSEKNRLIEIYNSLLGKFIKLVEENKFDKEEILVLRREIYKYSEVLSAYYIELKYLKDKIDELILKDREEKLEIAGKLDSRRKTIIDNIEVEVRSLVDYPMEYINFMATIINILPFRLSKYKYYDSIEKTLKFNLSGLPEEYIFKEINDYKKQFTPYLYSGYGIYFNEYFTDIELFKRRELEENRNEIEKYLDNIGYNMLNVRRIGILTNRILTIGMIDREYKVEYEEKIIELLKEDDKKTENQVREDFSKNEEKLLEIVDEFKRYNDEIFRREAYKVELDKLFAKSRSFLIYYNDIDFTDDSILEVSKEDESISPSELDKLIGSFLDFIKRNLKGLEVMESRIRMRTLLTKLTPPFRSSKEFMDYVNYSLNRRIITDKELNLVLISLNYLMNKNLGRN